MNLNIDRGEADSRKILKEMIAAESFDSVKIGKLDCFELLYWQNAGDLNCD